MSRPDQVAVFALRDGGDQACVIRRRGRRHWGIPKGFIDAGDTPEEAALAEASEEAGLVGEIWGPSIGTYTYDKDGDELVVAVYVMRVREVLPVWAEMDFRERSWVPISDLASRLRDHPVLPLVAALREVIPRERKR